MISMWLICIYFLIATIVYTSCMDYIEENHPRLLMSGYNSWIILFAAIFWLPMLILGIILKIQGKINLKDLDKD